MTETNFPRLVVSFYDKLHVKVGRRKVSKFSASEDNNVRLVEGQHPVSFGGMLTGGQLEESLVVEPTTDLECV